MGRSGDFEILQNNFSGGILSPRIQVRTDMAKSASGCDDILNMIPLPEGGLVRRPGVELHEADIKLTCGITGTIKLIPFIYSNNDNYVLIFSAEKVFFLKRDLEGVYRLLKDADGLIYGVKIDIEEEAVAEISVVQSFDVLFVTSAGEIPFKLKRKGEFNWVFEAYDFRSSVESPTITDAIPSTGLVGTDINLTYYVCCYGAMESIGRLSIGKGVTVKGLWASGETVKISWNEVVGVKEYNVYKQVEGGAIGYIGRSSGTNFLDNYITGDASRSPTRNPLSIFDSNSAEDNRVNINVDVASTAPFVYAEKVICSAIIVNKRPYAKCGYFTGSSINTYCHIVVKFNKDVKAIGTGVELIQSSNKEEVTASVRLIAGADGICKANKLYNVKLSSNKKVYVSGLKFNITVIDQEKGVAGFLDFQYPQVSSIYNQRLLFANTSQFPNTLFLSRTGLLYDFTVGSPLRDDDAIEIGISTLKGEVITHVVPLDDLHVFTTAGEYVCTGGNAPLSPTNSRFQYAGNCGSVKTLAPQIVGREILFISRDKKTVRTLSYNYDVDGYIGIDLTIMCRHLFNKRQIKQWCYQNNPHHLFYFVMDDGTLLTMTYMREHEIYAFAQHKIKGYHLLDVCTVPNGVDDDVIFVGRSLKTGREEILCLGDFDCKIYFDCGEVFESSFITTDLNMMQMQSQLGYKRRVTKVRLHVLESDSRISVETAGYEQKLLYKGSLQEVELSRTGIIPIMINQVWRDELKLKIKNESNLAMNILALHVDVEMGDLV